MKKNSYSNYTGRFHDFVYKFMETHQLFPQSGHIQIGVSTGIDSIALLNVFYHFLKQGRLKQLTVIHVNHGTREACVREEEFIVELCQKLKLNYEIKRIDKRPVNLGNFEAYAREKRYAIFHDLDPETFIATAHHIDDSFEWWLMNQLKTSTIDTLGIPVKNHNIIRPFLCVSKRQIQKYIKLNNLIYFEDESNLDLKFERNFMRHKIIGQIKKQYPKYLKHYVQRANLLLEEKKKAKNKIEITTFKTEFGTIIKFPLGTHPTVNLIKKEIQNYSVLNRGKLTSELIKLQKSILNGKVGPMNFSGGVTIYFNRSELFITNEKLIKMLSLLDAKLESDLKNERVGIVTESIKDILERDVLFFPGFIVTNDQSIQKQLAPLKKIQNLWPKTSSFLLQHGIYFITRNQLLTLVQKNPIFFTRTISRLNLPL